MTQTLYITLALLLSISNLSAQSTAHATASATIESLVGTITQGVTSTDVIIDNKAGSLELNAIRMNPIAAGGKRFEQGETHKLASFHLTASTYAYGITVPGEEIVLTRKGGVETMKARSFTLVPSFNPGADDTTQGLTIGATLDISSSQVNGYYLPVEPLDITVNYN